MSATKLTRAEVDRAGGYLAARLLQVEAPQRAGLLRAWLQMVPDELRPSVEEAVVLALSEIVSGCEAISPRAREWVRDEIAKERDPFADAERPHEGHTDEGGQ